MPNPTVILIADYGTGDPSFLEVTLQLKMLLPEALIYPQAVPPFNSLNRAFSTLNAGFWMYQIAMTPNLTNTYIYSNIAPRTEDAHAQANNRGEKLMYAKLTSGIEIIGVNSRFAYSFLKPHIETFHAINIPNEGSQFRSRDIFPKAVAQLVKKDMSFLGDKADIAVIPEYPRNVIVHIDGYGNLKTTMRLSEVSYQTGQKLTIAVHNKSLEAYFSDGMFNVPQGTLAFSPGSSGHEDKFMEIFYRGGSAAALFGGVRVEDAFTVNPSAK